MIYTKEHINEVVSKYLTIHEELNSSKLATVIQTAGDLEDLSHRQLRAYVGATKAAMVAKGTGNKLVIGDLHAPFILEGYLEFCIYLYNKYKCDSVMFIGDITDQHASSYHESDPDGLSAGDELYWAKKQLAPWYEAFPVADVMMGNHDLLVFRKAKTAGLSKHVLKPYGEQIGAPSTWTFHFDDIERNGVVYSHGNVGDAYKKATGNRVSTVQGHLHSKAGVQHFVSIKDAIYGMQVGCGVDRTKYAMAYGKPFVNKPVISAGVVLDNGRTPIVELMPL